MKLANNSEIPVGDEQEPEVHGYAEAEGILSTWSYNDPPEGTEVIWAIEKGRQAIRDCLEMGLNGVGD